MPHKSIRKSLPPMAVAANLAHAQTDRYRQRVDEALEIIQAGLAQAPDAYVSCSFGKDSAVILHLALQIKPLISIRFMRWSESEHLNNYDEIIEEWQQRQLLNLSILDMHRDSLAEKAPGRWQQLENLAPASGYVIGLRKEESRPRAITLASHGALYHKKDGMWRIAPLADWRTPDIGAYIVAHDLPMLNAYHAEGFDARTASRVPRSKVRGAALAKLKMRDPAAFERLAEMLPEVRDWV